MRSEKLYFSDAYIREFSACVLECRACGDKFEAVLDRTGFFPEGGGQSSDSGYIQDVAVTAVLERDGEIYHVVSSPLEIGREYECKIDFETRFARMQMHTAEHMLCGILHSLTGAENVGFHLTDEVTFDTDIPISEETLLRAEAMANEAVFSNLPVKAYFPSSEELDWLEYRSKLDLSDGVRVVEIEGVDACACCAPHVSRTGEIGLIKIISAESHRGGTRMRMVAGRRALQYVARLQREAARVSALLSAPILAISEACEAVLDSKAALEYKISKKDEQIVRILSENIDLTDGNAVVLLPTDTQDAARAFVNTVADRIGGLTVALYGVEGEYRYVIKIKEGNVMPAVKAANEALSGRGGGRDNVAEGRFSAALSDIQKYFGVE